MRQCTALLFFVAACGTSASGGGAVAPAEPPEIRLGEPEAALAREEEEPSVRADDGSWSGVLSCSYRISHGWGNVYVCAIVEALDGPAPPGPIGLHLTVGDTRLLTNTSSCCPQDIDDFVARFFPSERPYGPPSGYRDASGVYWILVTDGQTP